MTIGIVLQDMTIVTPIVGTAITAATVTGTGETENVVADTGEAGEMTDVSVIDTVAIRGIMMTSRDIFPAMKMIGVVTFEVLAKTNKAPPAVATMEVHLEEVVVVVAATVVGEVRGRTDLERPREGRQLPKAPSPCPNGNARLRVGTSTLQVTSNILLCRLNKQGYSTCRALTVLKSHPFLELQVFLPRCPSRVSAWELAEILICHASLVGSTSAALRRKSTNKILPTSSILK